MSRIQDKVFAATMSTLRTSPSPSPSNTIIQEMFNQSILVTLRGGPQNKTEILPILHENVWVNLKSLENLSVGIIQLALAFFLLQACAICLVQTRTRIKQENKKLNIPNPFTWLMNKYTQWKYMEILPIIRPKKAKESPFCGPQQTPPILPTCPRLDGAEKGQNIMFRFRGPTNSRIESEEGTETRITIVAVVENNNKPPLMPKPVVAVGPV